MSRGNTRLRVREIATFAMLGAIMFMSKKLLEWAPNIHPLTMLTMVYTLAYRKKGLIPVLVYLALETFITGGITWIVPYYYIFSLCWLCTLLLPTRLPRFAAQICYTLLCTLFGLLFGVLYAPWQALLYGLSFEKMLAWIAAGFSFDVTHAIGNFAASFLIFPLLHLLQKINRNKGVVG